MQHLWLSRAPIRWPMSRLAARASCGTMATALRASASPRPGAPAAGAGRTRRPRGRAPSLVALRAALATTPGPVPSGGQARAAPQDHAWLWGGAGGRFRPLPARPVLRGTRGRGSRPALASPRAPSARPGACPPRPVASSSRASRDGISHILPTKASTLPEDSNWPKVTRLGRKSAGIWIQDFFSLLLYFAWPLAARVLGNLPQCDLCGGSVPVVPPGDRLPWCR